MGFLNFAKLALGTNYHYDFEPKVVKTRSAHSCYGCGEIFISGSTLTKFTVKRGKQFSTTYWCNTCMCIANERLDNRELKEGELRDMYPEEYEV